jgi:chlorite dismutase
MTEPRTYIRWAFYRFADSWRAALDPTRRDRALDELASILDDPVAPHQLTYSLLGLRADADFAVWLKTDPAAPALRPWDAPIDGHALAPFQEFERRLRSSAAGDHLILAHNFISMTKPSPYARPETDPEREKLRAYPDGAPYVFVYPMVKTRAWYALSAEERGKLMREHVAVGHKYPKIRINTSYSYGIDDQEFVVAFEGDDPAEFLDLVHDLRFTRASQYTLRDTPMFTCVLRTPRALAADFRAAAAVRA